MAVAVYYGEAAVAAEGAGGDLYAGGGLAALVFVAVYGGDHLADYFGGVALGYHFGVALVVFYIGLDYRVEDVVGGEGVGVLLVFAQFGAGGFGEGGGGDDGLGLGVVAPAG